MRNLKADRSYVVEVLEDGFLQWSGKCPVPHLGDKVSPGYFPAPFESGEVVGYFQEDGFLGVHVRPSLGVEKWWKDQNPQNIASLFGAEIRVK